MKKLEKRLAARAGFTLVELIVVITILGILATVAVPAYTGYITKANEAADITNLDAIKTAVFAATATDGAPKTITVTADKVTYTNDESATAVEIQGDKNFLLFYQNGEGTFSMTFKSDYTKAEWTNGTLEWKLS